MIFCFVNPELSNILSTSFPNNVLENAIEMIDFPRVFPNDDDDNDFDDCIPLFIKRFPKFFNDCSENHFENVRIYFFH